MADNRIQGVTSPRGKLYGRLSATFRPAYYDGPYEVTPEDEDIILATKNKVMTDNVTVKASSDDNPDSGEIATDEEVNDVIDDIFGAK